METKQNYMELFDAHADEVFASFVRGGHSREKAVALTEQFFLSLAGQPSPAATVQKPAQQTPYFAFKRQLSS